MSGQPLKFIVPSLAYQSTPESILDREDAENINANIRDNLQMQFRPYYKNADASMLSLMRNPNWEKRENAAFADFKYIPENGQTYENASGHNPLWNDHLQHEKRRYTDNFKTPRLFEPTGTAIDLEDGYEQTYYERPNKPKRRRVNRLVTDSALRNAEPGYQNLYPDYTGAHQKPMDELAVDRHVENYQYGPHSKTSNFCMSDNEYNIQLPKKREKKPNFKNSVYESLYDTANSKYHNLKLRLLKKKR